MSLGLRQAAALTAVLAEDGTDLAATSLRFDAWCEQNIKPWFEDHVYWDATLLRRFNGEDIDVEAKIPSDVICAAADVDRVARRAYDARFLELDQQPGGGAPSSSNRSHDRRNRR